LFGPDYFSGLYKIHANYNVVKILIFSDSFHQVPSTYQNPLFQVRCSPRDAFSGFSLLDPFQPDVVQRGDENIHRQPVGDGKKCQDEPDAGQHRDDERYFGSPSDDK